MARTRQIKPEFWTDDDTVTLEPCAKLLFIGMWGLADKEGRLEDKPLSILMRILPREQVNPDLILGELAARGLIVRYVAAGLRVIQIRSFKKHQHIHPDEAKSKLPAPQEEKPNDYNGPRDSVGSNEIQLNPSESKPTSDLRLTTSDLPSAPPARDPTIPAGATGEDPKRPRSAYGILQLFGRLWGPAHNQLPWAHERFSEREASALVETITALPTDERERVFDDLPRLMSSYVKAPGYYAERAHPFELFAKDFNRIRMGPTSARASPRTRDPSVGSIPAPGPGFTYPKGEQQL